MSPTQLAIELRGTLARVDTLRAEASGGLASRLTSVCIALEDTLEEIDGAQHGRNRVWTCPKHGVQWPTKCCPKATVVPSLDELTHLRADHKVLSDGLVKAQRETEKLNAAISWAIGEGLGAFTDPANNPLRWQRELRRLRDEALS